MEGGDVLDGGEGGAGEGEEVREEGGVVGEGGGAEELAVSEKVSGVEGERSAHDVAYRKPLGVPLPGEVCQLDC